MWKIRDFRQLIVALVFIESSQSLILRRIDTAQLVRIKESYKRAPLRSAFFGFGVKNPVKFTKTARRLLNNFTPLS